MIAKLGYQQQKSGSPSKFQVAWGYWATTKSYTATTLDWLTFDQPGSTLTVQNPAVKLTNQNTSKFRKIVTNDWKQTSIVRNGHWDENEEQLEFLKAHQFWKSSVWPVKCQSFNCLKPTVSFMVMFGNNFWLNETKFCPYKSLSQFPGWRLQVIEAWRCMGIWCNGVCNVSLIYLRVVTSDHLSRMIDTLLHVSG